jgi:hypothetical protein
MITDEDWSYAAWTVTRKRRKSPWQYEVHVAVSHCSGDYCEDDTIIAVYDNQEDADQHVENIKTALNWKPLKVKAVDSTLSPEADARARAAVRKSVENHRAAGVDFSPEEVREHLRRKREAK